MNVFFYYQIFEMAEAEKRSKCYSASGMNPLVSDFSLSFIPSSSFFSPLAQIRDKSACAQLCIYRAYCLLTSFWIDFQKLINLDVASKHLKIRQLQKGANRSYTSPSPQPYSQLFLFRWHWRLLCLISSLATSFSLSFYLFGTRYFCCGFFDHLHDFSRK